MKKPVYLDYAATTPVDPAVADEMIKYLTLDGVLAIRLPALMALAGKRKLLWSRPVARWQA